MATTDDSFDGMREWCGTCDSETLHQVSIQMRTESSETENAQFSRETYRVAECQRCGGRSSQRMNDR